MKGLRNWALGFLATAVMVAVSYQWLDRPIALFVHDHPRHAAIFEALTYIPEATIPIAVIVFVVLAAQGLMRRPLSRLQTVFLLSGTSLAVAVIIKDRLKHAFGRTWPDTWTHNNPSFLGDGTYGFFPFEGGGAYASFPSGHTTAVCTVMTVLWLCYPRYRALYALCMAAGAIGLVGANFHFLGDVIAGGFLGISVGWLSVTLWETGAHRVRPNHAAAEKQPSDLPPENAAMPSR